MRLPRLLDGSLNELARLNPSHLSVTENLTPLSTAELMLPMGEATPVVRQFVELYGPNGSLGVYRVAAARTDYGQRQTVSLEHGICTLEDCTAPEEAELSGSMRTILTAILSWQHDVKWQLGDVDVPEDAVFAISAGNQLALQVLIDAAALCYGYALVFDQTTSPWTLHLRALATEVSSECRLSRNVSSVGIAWDESELCTRVTSSLLFGGYMDAPTVSKWGVISRPLEVEDDTTAEAAAALANEYLDAHKDPRISVEIDALELAALTGNPYDGFRLGDLCQVALKEWGVTATERIVSVYRPDVYGAPEEVQLTLSTMARSTQASLAGLRSSMARSNRSNSQQFKYIREELDKIVIEAPTVELLARVAKIEEVNGDQELQLNEAMIRLDGAEAAILLKADQTAYNELAARVSSAEVAIDGANAAISLKASQTTVDDLGERVSAAEIAIDGANSRIDLKADLILLDGYVKAAEFETMWLSVLAGASIATINADFVGCDNLNVGGTASAANITAQNVDTAGLSATSISLGGVDVSSYTLSMGEVASSQVFAGGDIDLNHSHAVTVNDDGTVTLGEVSSSGGSFNIADTAFYQEGVSAAVNGVTLSADGWDGLTNTVRASNGKSYVVPFPTVNLTGGDSFDSSHKTTVNAVTPGSSSYINRLTVDASSVYNSGYDAGYAAAIASAAFSVSGTNVIVTFGNGQTISLDVKSYVSARADVKYQSSTSTTITVRGWGYAYFNGVSCASVYKSATYDTV